MRYKVTGKQENSKMCLVCGLKNDLGLQAAFYELENGELLAVFRPRREHQGYPDRLHGGIATAILDETIFRTIFMQHPEQTWGVAVEFTTRFKKSIPLDQTVRCVGRMISETRRSYEGAGEILLPDGTVAAEGRGRYLKMPLEKISDFDAADQEWQVIPSADDPSEVEL